MAANDYGYGEPHQHALTCKFFTLEFKRKPICAPKHKYDDHPSRKSSTIPLFRYKLPHTILNREHFTQ
jgi:hypothetical protein